MKGWPVIRLTIDLKALLIPPVTSLSLARYTLLITAVYLQKRRFNNLLSIPNAIIIKALSLGPRGCTEIMRKKYPNRIKQTGALIQQVCSQEVLYREHDPVDFLQKQYPESRHSSWPQRERFSSSKVIMVFMVMLLIASFSCFSFWSEKKRPPFIPGTVGRIVSEVLRFFLFGVRWF